MMTLNKKQPIIKNDIEKINYSAMATFLGTVLSFAISVSLMVI